MRFVHSLPAALAVAAGLIFLSAFQVSAERIYHWKNRDGASCYSNTNIPAGVSELSVMSAAGYAVTKAAADGAGGAGREGADGATAVDGSGEVPGAKAAALQARIENRSAAIRYIETLLRTYPDDADLRKHLERKRQYLNEDLILLKLIED